MITSRNKSAPQETCRAQFRVDKKKAKQLFSTPLMFVSIYSKYHTDESLKASLALMHKKFSHDPDQFKTLDVLVSGTLQRHNYWALTENLTNKKISKVLKGLSIGLSLEELAIELAKKFLPLAKKAENNYITNNLETYFSNLPDSKVNLIPWERMVPGIIQDKDNANNYGEYDQYYTALKNKMATDKSVADAFQGTSDRLLQAKKTLIMAQGQRMRSLSPALSHLSNSDLETLASICSRNFLMEEAPLLFARLGDLNYSSIIYPAALTEAFKVTKELFSYKQSMPEWVVVHISGLKKSDEYADSDEAKVGPVPVLQRSLSLGSLTVQTRSSHSLLQKIFFLKPKEKKLIITEEKCTREPSPRNTAQVTPYLTATTALEDPSTARTETSTPDISTPKDNSGRQSQPQTPDFVPSKPINIPLPQRLTAPGELHISRSHPGDHPGSTLMQGASENGLFKHSLIVELPQDSTQDVDKRGFLDFGRSW
jgi:hypothetical protein